MSSLFEDSKNKDIVIALIKMAESMGFRVIAEGAETLGQAEFVRDNGCDLVQGRAFDMPMPAHEATDLLSKSTHYVLPEGTFSTL